MTTSLLDAFDLVAHSDQLQLRLEAASAELAKRPGFAHEKAWLEVARQRVSSAAEGIGDLLTRSLRLPELEPLKGDHARVLQGAAVDALERLHAGITFAGGNRAPLIEALYWKLKIPVLRRCSREEFEQFCVDFETRLKSSYARRMLADPAYEVVGPALKKLHGAFASWRGIFTSAPLSDAEASALRAELESVARRLELPCRQARLLGQAALLPLKDIFDASGLLQKPKRRGPREADEDNHPILEQDPPDPAEPSPEELAELAAARAAADASAAARAAEAVAAPVAPASSPSAAEPAPSAPVSSPAAAAAAPASSPSSPSAAPSEPASSPSVAAGSPDEASEKPRRGRKVKPTAEA